MTTSDRGRLVIAAQAMIGPTARSGRIGGGKARRLLETAQECALLHAGLIRQDRQPRLLALAGLQEMLRLEDRAVAMVQAQHEAAIITLLAPRLPLADGAR